MDIKVDENTIVVFDLDDTLYNELDYLRSAYLHIAKQLEPQNWKLLFVSMFSQFRSKKDVFEMVSNTYSLPKTELIQLYRDHEPEIKPFPGVLRKLQRIKERHGKIGIITDGRKITQMNKLKALGVIPFVDYCVISEEIGSEKPHEKNFSLLEEKFGPGQYYYIADNPKKDFITPNSLGWKTLGLIDNGRNIHTDAYMHLDLKYRPKEFFTRYTELRIF